MDYRITSSLSHPYPLDASGTPGPVPTTEITSARVKRSAVGLRGECPLLRTTGLGSQITSLAVPL